MLWAERVRARRAARMARAARTARSARVALALAVLCVGARGLHAAEHITLRNGFELNCDHRGAAVVDGESVRLYLDAGGANYVDVHPAEIVSAEWVAAEPMAAELVLAEPGGAEPGGAERGGVEPGGVATGAATGMAGTGMAGMTGSRVAGKGDKGNRAGSLLANGGTAGASARAELSPAELHELLASAGVEHDIDVDLLASLVHAESGSHTHAVSRAGAQGLMQLMPGTAAELGVHDSFAPEDNVHGGTAYLDSLLKRYHDNLALALAAYNAGAGAVDRYHGVPPYRETRAYVARIIHEFNQRYAARQAAAAMAMAK